MKICLELVIIWNPLLGFAGRLQTTPEKFWVVHDFVKMNPLYEVVNDIRRFLTSTKELVILDFHRYENS